MSYQIIACIDGSISSTAVCDWAAWASVTLQIPLILLHTLDNPSKVDHANLTGSIGLGSREQLLEELAALDEQRNKIALQQGKLLLKEAHHRVVADGVKESRCLQRHGSLIETLLELEPETKLVVIGRQGEQTQAQTDQIGSQLETIIRTLHCPILVALPDYKPPKEVMIAFDASPTAKKVLDKLLEHSHMLDGVTCHLVMVNKNNHKAAFLTAKKSLEDRGINVVSILLEGEVESALSDYAKMHAIDLIVMGAFGHSKIRQFFVGSTTSHMLHTTKIPLLLLR